MKALSQELGRRRGKIDELQLKLNGVIQQDVRAVPLTKE